MKSPSIINFFMQKAHRWELLVLIIFVVLITAQPFFLHHEIIMMETGIHLPGINALMHGAVPYRDFFFLRGPLELYVPAWMMSLGGMNSAMLPVFYYVGTILTLIFCVVLAFELFKTRLILWAFVPAFVARTFPRVSYYYWGGMRYAIGFLAIVLLFYFFKTQKRRWLFCCGIVCALSALTTIEAGFSTVFAVVVALVFAGLFRVYSRSFLIKAFGIFSTGFCFVILPYLVYLIQTDSLRAIIDSTYVVAVLSNGEFPGAPGIKPESIIEFLLAGIPGSKFFKYMTPVWCYVFFAGYLFQKMRVHALNWVHAFLVGLTGYGIILYAAAFRKIEGHHFEMALQAEKFIYFFLIECALLYALARWTKTDAPLWRRRLIYAVVIGVLISSVGYAIQRCNHRFTSFKWIKKNVFQVGKVKGLTLLDGMPIAVLDIERARGHIVPHWQKEEIEGVVRYLRAHTDPKESVFCFPEIGNFNFWADRPFIGRFPIGTFSWFYEPWFQEFVDDFQKAKPRFVVMTHVGHRTFPDEWYFRNPRNRRRFDFMTGLIQKDYTLVESFEAVGIYKRNDLIEN